MDKSSLAVVGEVTLAANKIIVDALGPWVENVLANRFGDNWLDTVNSFRRSRNPGSVLASRSDGSVPWDVAALLVAMLDCWPTIQRAIEGSYKDSGINPREIENSVKILAAYVDVSRDLRHRAAHFPSAKFDEKDRNRFLDLMAHVLRMIGLVDHAEQLEALNPYQRHLQPSRSALAAPSVTTTADSAMVPLERGEEIAALYRIDDIPAKVRESTIKRLSSNLSSRGWNLSELENGSGCTFTDFNVKLVIDRTLLSFKCLPSEWLAYQDNFADDLRVFAISQKQEQAFNDAKIRLASDFVGLDQAEVSIQRTDYLSSIMTDQLAWRRIRSKALAPDGMSAERVLWDGLSEFIWEDGRRNGTRLKGFAEAQVSNQLGASTLAFSNDGHLMLVVQNDKNRQSANLLAPTGSGSLDWRDVENCGSHDLLQLVRFGAERELWEEASLDEHGAERKIDSRVMVFGFARMLHRAGKPEFFLIGRIDALAQEICDRRKELYVQRVLTSGVEPLNWKSVHLAADLIRLCSDYLQRTYLDSRAQRIGLSYPLEHSLRILIDVCRNEAAAFKIEAFLAGH
ncbi:hypothetical protein NK6_4493 [Bradyrhizobium diazoefficiens]|uniref:Swt1-like HEPN domain-containing protein n=1 Tax=Bradyrhizobium diazoefficiens TaxID=1355477 RepID=A0A0E3VUM3_9BRAD|nr:hypothetical protein NK6_4493 [Bradyrhizobium diazoefficiens]